MEQLRMQVGLTENEEIVPRLTHVCSADDFLMRFKADDVEEFVPDAAQLEMAYAQNEARVRLAMQVGIHPIYVDNQHLQLWEMANYVRIAKAAGYEPSIVSPLDVFPESDSVDAIEERNSGRPEARAASRAMIEASLAAFEPLPDGDGAVEAA